MALIITLVLIAATVTAILLEPKEKAEEKNETEVTTSSVISHPEVTGTDHGEDIKVYYEFTRAEDIYNNNDAVLIASTVYYPIIGCDNVEVEAAINNDIYKFAETEVKIEDFEKDLADEKYLFGQSSPEGFIQFEFVLNCEAIYAKNSYVSLIFREMRTVGITEPSEKLICLNYDLRTGERISLSRILGSDDAFANNYLFKVFDGVIKARPTSFYNDAEDTLKDVININDFYLDEIGLTLFFNPEIISPRVYGVITYTIPYSDLGF